MHKGNHANVLEWHKTFNFDTIYKRVEPSKVMSKEIFVDKVSIGVGKEKKKMLTKYLADEGIIPKPPISASGLTVAEIIHKKGYKKRTVQKIKIP